MAIMTKPQIKKLEKIIAELEALQKEAKNEWVSGRLRVARAELIAALMNARMGQG